MKYFIKKTLKWNISNLNLSLLNKPYRKFTSLLFSNNIMI